MEIPGSEKEELEVEMEMSDVEPCISVNALIRNHNFQTMRVTGVYDKRPLTQLN